MPLRSRSLVPGLLLLLAAACDAGEVGPSPAAGRVVLEVVSPTGQDGAAVLELAGAAHEVEAIDGRAFAARDGERTRLVVVRERPGRIRVTMRVADADAPPPATLLEVADGLNRVVPLEGFAVEYRR